MGASIAIFNVLLPKYDPGKSASKISFLTTLYVTAMGISTAIASYLSVPITQASSWKGLIPRSQLSLSGHSTSLVAKSSPQSPPRKPKEKQVKENILKSKDVWAIIIFGGLQSLLFYTSMTWFANYGC